MTIRPARSTEIARRPSARAVALGEKGTVIDVAPGYPRRHLVPRELAQPATRAQLLQRTVLTIAQPRLRPARLLLLGPLLLVLSAALAPAAGADPASLARHLVPRPGPPLLYRAPAVAPQLTNAGPWRAPPILVSGATAYRDGEFLYQDFLYDDHGARASRRDPNDPRAGGDAFSPPNGTYTYPRSRAFAENAADLVELRLKRVRGATLFRLTFNTMVDPSRMAAVLALGTSATPREIPGANTRVTAKVLVTWHGDTAFVPCPTTTCDPSSALVPAAVDRRRRQVTLTVPDTTWRPAAGRNRVAAATGLWDRAADSFLIPRAASDATHPGGAGGLARPSAFFNVAFRSEPLPRLDTSALTDPAWWRDRRQGAALARGDLGALHADVDFRKLARRVPDDTGVPRAGALSRILASHTETEQGADYATTCTSAVRCEGELRGRLQPYALYVPRRRPVRGRHGLTLLLHSLTANYNQFTGSRNQAQFGERPGGASLVLTPGGRGPDGWYYDRAGADTWEAWADVAARYRLDPGRTAIAGYSMGATAPGSSPPSSRTSSGRPSRRSGRPRSAPGRRPRRRPRAASARTRTGCSRRCATCPSSPGAPSPTSSSPTRGRVARPMASTAWATAMSSTRSGRPRSCHPPRPRTTSSSRPTTSSPRPPPFSAPRAWCATPSGSPTPTTRRWTSRAQGRRPVTRTGSPAWSSGGRAARRPWASSTSSRADGVAARPRWHRLATGSAACPRARSAASPFRATRRTWGRVPRRPPADVLEVRTRNVASFAIDARRAGVSCHPRVVFRRGGPVAIRIRNCR